MNILLQLSKLKRSPKMAGIRKYTNLLYYDPNFINIDVRNYDVIESDGCKFRVTDQINCIIPRVKENSCFDGIRSTDIVVDIGANIGAITIPLAKVAKKVYAVEPLFYKELEDNISLNGLDNVEVIPFGIGKECSKVIKFSSKCAESPIITFDALKRQVGEQIDFLKMDGEGCEWEMEPYELKGIRELRLEFHIHRGRVSECRRKYEEYLNWMKVEGYESHTICIDGGLNPSYKCYKGAPGINASLK